jgi:hypothetical protein
MIETGVADGAVGTGRAVRGAGESARSGEQPSTATRSRAAAHFPIPGL